MLARESLSRAVFAWKFLAAGTFLVAMIGLGSNMAVPNEPVERQAAARAGSPPDGKELFAREWIPDDSRSHGGDGLGPVFNDSSCVGCHNLGGAGGGGPANKNVHIVTTRVPKKVNGKSKITTNSFVLHHFSTDPQFKKWRARFAPVRSVGINTASVLTRLANSQPGGSTIPFGGSGIARQFIADGTSSTIAFLGNTVSQRNTPALFGAGKIDSVEERVLTELAKKKYAKFPQVTGRVARGKDGQPGRFGWKAQKSSLEDFVLTACAVEVGLHVPGHDQPPLPHKQDYKAPALDMNQDECNALVSYVRSLPQPAQMRPAKGTHTQYIKDGKDLFGTVGCATCHTPNLGQVAGIYSDLLLHDMGLALSDIGSSYGVFRPSPAPSPKPDETPVAKGSGQPKPGAVAATAQEWRTPPLWGVRDSGPYLHDGRATTLQQSIAFHQGEAIKSLQMYNKLSPQEKQKLIAFLKSLVAPG